jgi:protein SCO1/2
LKPLLVSISLFSSMFLLCASPVESPLSHQEGETNVKIFRVKGVVRELKPDDKTIVIRHEAIPDYMEAMTMPFKAKEPAELKALRPGDEISFRLHVNETESWVDEIRMIGRIPPGENQPEGHPPPTPAPVARPGHLLLDFKFTDELGRRVSLNDFRGQALAITFFFTRCPIPDFCPRLSKNFEEASHKLGSLPGAPTNWHFLSVSFDTEFDTPAVLKAYGERYHYDPQHWSFLTGPKEKINELAMLSGVEVKGQDGLFNHNFRTLIIDAAGKLQATFPFGGDLSDIIVHETLQACVATNESVPRDPGGGHAKAEVAGSRAIESDKR